MLRIDRITKQEVQLLEIDDLRHAATSSAAAK